MVEFGKTENLMDLLTQYQILRFYRCGLNRLEFYQILGVLSSNDHG